MSCSIGVINHWIDVISLVSLSGNPRCGATLLSFVCLNSLQQIHAVILIGDASPNIRHSEQQPDCMRLSDAVSQQCWSGIRLTDGLLVHLKLAYGWHFCRSLRPQIAVLLSSYSNPLTGVAWRFCEFSSVRVKENRRSIKQNHRIELFCKRDISRIHIASFFFIITCASDFWSYVSAYVCVCDCFQHLLTIFISVSSL